MKRTSSMLLLILTLTGWRRIEVVDAGRGVVGDPQTWAPPSVDFKP